MDDRDVQPLKTILPISTLGGRIMVERLRQSSKALSPISHKPSGSVTEERLLQPAKALSPILVTLLPIITDLSPSQQIKARSLISVTLSGIVIDDPCAITKSPFSNACYAIRDNTFLAAKD